jgi:7-carboxy-7-deazaguanine synthase
MKVVFDGLNLINKKTLRITEIFFSLQGETKSVGLPTVFVRLTGCPLRCVYCDTAYAFKGGSLISIEDICKQITQYSTRYITITGGEPLAQPECITLLSMLCEQNYIVSLETSGALDVSAVDPRVIKILDLKTPASGEVHRNIYDNLSFINKHDQIKLVICNRTDYEWAKDVLEQYQLPELCEVLFSPSYSTQSARQLAEWILEDQLPVRLQIQLHKILWGDVPGK